jgi:hypothetical protein
MNVRDREQPLVPRLQVFHPTFINWGSQDKTHDCIIITNDIQISSKSSSKFHYICVSIRMPGRL